MIYGLGFRVLRVFFGFGVQGSRLRVETVRLGLIVKLSQASQGGGGWWQGRGGGGTAWGGPARRGFNLAPANRPLSDCGRPRGYPFQAEKGGFGLGGRIRRGVLVLTT